MPMFDDAILIDWASTDDSVGIIRELAPHWKVIPSKHVWFSAANADGEIMEHERTVDGWKMALCTTEFLLVDDLESHCQLLERENKMGFVAFGRAICDTFKTMNDPVFFDRPILRQKFWGAAHHDLFIRKDRMMHRWPDGNYSGGRHSTLHDHSQLLMCWETFIAWLALAPYNKETKERKLQIQKKVPESSIVIGDSHHHVMTPEKLEEKFRYSAEQVYNLLEQEEQYRQRIEHLPARYDP